MAAKLEMEGVVLTLVGDFNPPIFTPHWFAAHDLIDMSEADDAKVKLVHDRLAHFSTAWFDLVVNDEKFQLSSLGEVSIRTFDLMVRVFADFLPHTPVRACGINFVAHFRVDNWRVLHALGDAVAPKDPWGEFGALLGTKPPKNYVHAPNDMLAAQLRQSGRAGGLRSIALELSVRPDDLPGSLTVKLEPSNTIHPGVFIEVNDHYQGTEQTAGSMEIISIVQGKFDLSIARARGIVDHFMNLSRADA